MNNDLISREALKTAIEDKIDYIPASEFDDGWNNAIKAVIDEIDNAPTVEERPHGKWITNYESQFFNPGRSCSLCNKTVEFSENFCPNCGAHMRSDNDGKK